MFIATLFRRDARSRVASALSAFGKVRNALISAIQKSQDRLGEINDTLDTLTDEKSATLRAIEDAGKAIRGIDRLLKGD